MVTNNLPIYLLTYVTVVTVVTVATLETVVTGVTGVTVVTIVREKKHFFVHFSSYLDNTNL